MDPVTRAALANTIIPATRIGETAAVTPATAAAIANAQAAPLVASAQVDISPLGQFLSGVALSRRQMLALQGAAEQAGGAGSANNLMPDVLAVAEQLTQSFAQLQTSGIDASQLATLGNGQDNLAQRYDLLSGDGTTDTDSALAQNGNLLTQAGLARIGVDLRGEQVDPAALQLAFEADRSATLDALQQGTDVMAQVGAALAQQQGQAAASAVDADLNGQAAPATAAVAAQADGTQVDARTDVQARQQAEALAQRQREVQQQMESEELVQDMQSLQESRQLQEQQGAERLRAEQQADALLQEQQVQQLLQEQQLQQTRQAQQALPAQQSLQAQDAAAQRTQALQDGQQRVQAARSEREEAAAQSVAREQQAVSQAEELRQDRLQTDQAQQAQQAQLQQAQLQQRVQQAADEAAQAQLDASEAQRAARAAAERAQQLAREAQTQLDAGQAATAQAQLAQQNMEVQQRAAQNAAQVNPPPSSQDPSVAAAIAAYNLTNAASGLANRPAGDTQRPLVTPVAAVEPAKPVNRIQANIDSRS